MGITDGWEQKPLWLEIEEKIQGLPESELSGGGREATVRKVADELDENGLNVSGTAEKMLALRWALDQREKVGRSLLGDIRESMEALTLDDVSNPHTTTIEIMRELSGDWPLLKEGDRIRDLKTMVETTRLDLLIAEAKKLEGDKGVRYLRKAQVDDDVILKGLDIPAERLAEVDAAMAAEEAEIRRVKGLLEDVAGKPELDRIKHLLNHDVAEDLMVEIAEVDQTAIDEAKVAMEEEMREKQRLAEEEAARKKAEAEGPALEDIPADEMLEHIEAIREILEFSDEEKEIRVMCEQSGIPKALVEITVSEPDKLDELEEKAEAEA